MDPRLLICDEPVSALDVSIRAQIMNLFMELQDELGLSYLFIAHDLGVVRQISHRVAVMYLGRIVETAPVKDLYERPRHPYTKALISALPSTDPDRERSRNRIVLRGEIPSPADPPTGCRFHTRCPVAESICTEKTPALLPVAPDHVSACHLN
jgi:oligopeptide transport system ATP-binding protein